GPWPRAQPGAAPGEGKAPPGAGRGAVIEPGRAARRRGGEIVAADHRGIAGGAVRAAVARAPRAPALLEAWRLRRRFQYLCISERDVVRQLCALRRKPDRGAAERVASAVDERIEHDAEELVAELERALLRAGRRFAREQRERVGEIGAGEIEQGEEIRRQRAAVVEECVDRIGDVALVAAEGARERARSARRARAGRQLSQRGGEVQNRVGRGVAQRGREAGGQIAG